MEGDRLLKGTSLCNIVMVREWSNLKLRQEYRQVDGSNHVSDNFLTERQSSFLDCSDRPLLVEQPSNHFRTRYIGLGLSRRARNYVNQMARPAVTVHDSGRFYAETINAR